jgi:predicted nuclease with TOPRIM domain
MEEVTLRELIEVRLNSIDSRISDLKSAIEKLTEGAIREERFKSTVHKVETLQKLVSELEDQIDEKTDALQTEIITLRSELAEAKHQLKNYRAIGGVIVALLIIVVGAWLKSILGI